ncbi:hypothetical protein Glove_123g148 [Diversispora epigaea]|uniref:Uncharacterized protein n=1 Tax=Diversispora epigaea TaxID=1348612 RepID=A0A397J376_9GLOM|nr:hypothetical protein Glove_123g148 [Diversispora epigaea]
MDFYSANSVENWTQNKIIEHYQKKEKSDRKRTLDRIKKDLQEVVVSPDFDDARRNKAKRLLIDERIGQLYQIHSMYQRTI